MSRRDRRCRYSSAPVTYDRLVSMAHGPVPSRTLDMINGYRTETWDRWMTRQDNHWVRLAHRDFDRDALDEPSDADLEIVDEISDNYGSMGQRILSDHIRQNCEECYAPQASPIPIHERAIFRALGWSRQDAVRAQQFIEDQHALDRAFEARPSSR